LPSPGFTFQKAQYSVTGPLILPFLGTLAGVVSVADMVALSSLVQTVKKLRNRGLIVL